MPVKTITKQQLEDMILISYDEFTTYLEAANKKSQRIEELQQEYIKLTGERFEI